MKYPKTVWYVVAPTRDDGRDYCFEGSSGLVTIAEARGWIAPGGYNTSRLTLRLINGSRFIFRSAEKPERLRGANGHGAWVDEPGSMPKVEEVAKQLDALIRAPFPDGHPTTILWTGTPSRLPYMVHLITEAKAGRIGLREGKSADNLANLSPDFAHTIAKYAGTEWGRQEYEGILLTAVKGALWNDDMLDAMWIDTITDTPQRALIIVDPAASRKETSDLCGILVGLTTTDHYLDIIDDQSRHGLPTEWGEKVVDLALKWEFPYSARGVLIVYEANLVGEWIEDTLRTIMRRRGEELGRVVDFPMKGVHATENKETRAEPIAGLCAGARPKVRLLRRLTKVGDELVSWIPRKGMPSPNRLDCVVWGGREVFGEVLTRKKEGPVPKPRPTAAAQVSRRRF